jgi:hypothetical protein
MFAPRLNYRLQPAQRRSLPRPKGATLARVALRG